MRADRFRLIINAVPADARKSDDVERVREASDLVAIASRYITLREAGGQMVGLCPFHEDTKPSFSVSPSKQLYYCFGCGAGGNVFSFLMRIEGLTFGEALKKLAAEAGIELRGGRREAVSELAPLRKAVSLAEKFYRSALRGRNEYAAAARKYLSERGVSEETVERFGLGLAPDAWDSLLGHASHEGVDPRIMEAAGLAVLRKDGSGYYDRFRRRIIFPIYDAGGQPIAFGGRTFGRESDTPKYINSPNTRIYDKSRTAYNLDRARAAVARESRVLVVEGYFDVIGVYQTGVENVIATCGTALSEDLAKTLVRFAEEVVMFFDGDTAGQAATARAMAHLLESGARVRVVVMPAGRDPFDVAVTLGREGVDELTAGAVDWLDFVFAKTRERYKEDETGSKLAVIREVEGLIAKVPSPVGRAFWLDRFAKALGIETRMIDVKRAAEPTAKTDPTLRLDAETNLLRVLLRYPLMIEDYRARLERITFYDERTLRIMFLLREYAGRENLIHLILDELEPEDQRFVTELVLLERPGEDYGYIASACIRELERRQLEKKREYIAKRFLEGETDETASQEALDFAEEMKRFRDYGTGEDREPKTDS